MDWLFVSCSRFCVGIIYWSNGIMSQDQDTASPCVGVCNINPEYNLCRGCYRTPDEVRLWFSLPDQEKRNIRKICERKKKLLGNI